MDNSQEGNGSSPPPIDHGPSSSYDTLLQFISEMLMKEEEEELSNNPFHNGLALQATEKSLYNALHNINLDSSCGTSLKSNYDSLYHSPSSSGVKKNHRSWEDSCDLSEHHTRSHKQSANNNAYGDESEPPAEMYDEALLCSNSDRTAQTCGQTAQGKAKSGPKPKSGGGEKNDIIDLRSLLMQCAQAVANFDNKTLRDLLWEIRQHSSPRGDGMERAAHYFANAFEARLACTGTDLYAALSSKKISIVEILKAYKMFVIACPFRTMSNILANNIIGNLAYRSRAATLHIIDFGIFYGFQWPCLINALSEIPGGPRSFASRVLISPDGIPPYKEGSGHMSPPCKVCREVRVPFEYKAMAQKWDTVKLQDLGIEKNELLVVNCMHRLHNVPDDTETGESPRDTVLNLIKKINPDLFVHGVANGTYDTPFFVPRFREAFFHFSTMFDMFDATIPRDDKDRLLYEKHFFGKEVMNIIACEGTERVERPETYKHWQARIVRAGFRQVPIDQGIVKRLSKVKTGYHKSFSVDEERKWILLGWKGRVIQGFSCWRPTHN